MRSTAKTSAFTSTINDVIISELVNKTTNSYNNSDPYAIALPSNIDIFSNIDLNKHRFNNTVDKQIKQILANLYSSLQNTSRKKIVSNSLPKLSLVKQEDLSALLEWNFKDFRVGFTSDHESAKSGYYIVSQDKSLDSVNIDAKEFDKNIQVIINKIVNYVLENT
jgi:hypothetical protein